MTTLLQDIKTQVLQRTGMEFANSATDPEWLAMINSSAAELYEILIANKDLGYFETELSFTITSGNVQPYPADFKEILAVDYKIGDIYYDCHRYNNNARNYYTASSGMNSIDRHYRLTQAGIKFMPENAALGDYRITYIPRYVPKTALTDNIGDLELDNWHEYIVADCCIKFLTKQETDCQVFIMQKQSLMDRIVKSSANRDANEPHRLTSHIHDHHMPHDGTPRRY